MGSDTSSLMPARMAATIAQVGIVTRIDRKGRAVVSIPGRKAGSGLQARSMSAPSADWVGREVVLIFENGNPKLPIVLGLLHNPSARALRRKPVRVSADGERVTVVADKELILQCGEASITLTRSGKILIRGNYLLSRSTGVNAIKGGSVQIN